MAKNKKKPGVMLYFDIRPSLSRMTKEQQGEMFCAILDYGEYGTEPEFSDQTLYFVWDFIKPRLEKDDEAYKVKAEKAKAAADARWSNAKNAIAEDSMQTDADAYGRNQSHTDASGGMNTDAQECESMRSMPTSYSTSTTSSNSKSHSYSHSETDSDVPFPGAQTAKVSRYSMKIPTLDDVIEYAETRGRVDLAKTFFNYYNVAGWRDSTGAKVRNWKQKFITWEQKNQKPVQRSDQPQKTADGRTRYIDFNDDSLFLN